jgi:hypothetical protein
VRKGLAWLGGALGVAALLQAIRRRRRRPAAVDSPPAADPADELRSTLADTRAAEGPTPTDAPAAGEEPVSLEERRRRVHEQAQEAIDAMREPPPAS